MIDKRAFIENEFEIVNKEEIAVPFILNGVQVKYYDMLIADYGYSLDGAREILLKARQEGMSSFILALFTVDFLTSDNTVSICISHRTDSTKLLFKKVKFYFESYCKKHGWLSMDLLKTDNRGELENRSNGSMFYIGTAGAKVGGRGGTARNVLFCVGDNTKLILPNGCSKRIKNINVGDWVIAQDGSKTKVVNKWDTGIKSLRKIRLWYGNETIEVSQDHKIAVASFSFGRASYPIWKKASELKTNDYVLWAYPKSTGIIKQLVVQKQKNSIHLSNNTTKLGGVVTGGLVLKTDYSLGYMFGYYLAEGTITKNLNSVSFTCHKDEIFYKNFEGLLPIKPKISIRIDKGGTRKVITYNSRELAVFINRHVGRVNNKHVPEKFVYQMPREFLKGMFDGWKDGDSSKTQIGHISIVSIREKIARQMRQIYAFTNHKIAALDYYPNRFRYNKRTCPAYFLRIYDRKTNKKIKQTYTCPRNISEKNGFLYIRIKEIKDIGFGHTCEIKVSHKSHSFLTVGGVISNSEAAFYPNTDVLTAREIIEATAQQIPQESGSIFIESTANGYGNYYQLEWERARTKDSNYTARFFSWEEFYSDEWVEKKKLDFQDEKMWRQEYPRTEEDAFISSGTPFFDSASMEWIRHNTIKDPTEKGRLATDGSWI